MNFRSQKLLLPLIALLLVTSTQSAVGQFKDVPPKYEEFGIVCLLGFPSVVDQLKADYDLAEDNVKPLKELGRNRLRNMHLRRDFRMKTRKMDDEKFSKARAKLSGTIQKSNSEAWAKAKELLTDKQIARLKELRIQRLGPAALMDAEVVQALSLKDEQLRLAMAAKKKHDQTLVKLKADLLKARSKMKLAPQSTQDFQANRDMVKALGDAKISERKKVFAAVLTDQQKSKLDSLMGAPFVFKLDFDFPAIKVDWQTDPLKDKETKAKPSGR